MSKILPSRPTYTYTEQDWVQLRAHFMGSILVDIHLHKLAQNIGASWPTKDKEETPARYLEYSFAELLEAPGLKGQPARVQLLLDILKETASFDDPFQEMVQTTAAPGKSVENAAQLLRRSAIPPEYPIEFTALSPETRNLCAGEGAVTIGDAVALFQGMAQSVIVGGEVRELLNSLAHSNVATLSSYLPVRPGTKGLHLAEAIGILIRALPDSAREACITSAQLPHLPNPEGEATLQTLRERLGRLLELFPAEAKTLADLGLNQDALGRFFIPLAQPDLEKIAVLLVRRHLAPPVEPEPETVGIVGRLTRLFRRS